MDADRKEALVHFGRKMVDSGLTRGSGGNLSVIDRSTGQIAITPSGLAYAAMQSADIVTCDTQGAVLQGSRQPSSEISFHTALYRHRRDIAAVVHTHSVYATTLACLHLEIPPVHYLVGFAGAKVPLAPYATFGTVELADSIVAAIGRHNAVLMANHGLVAVGPTIAAAFNVAEAIELVAQIYYQALAVGNPKILSNEQMQAALERFSTYGQPSD